MRVFLGMASLLLAAPVSAVAAEPVSPDKMLVASSPSADGFANAPLETISLSFAEPVRLLSVTLSAPDDSQQEIFQQSYAAKSPKKKGKSFDFALPVAARQPGRYSLSYLLTSKSFKSLNGFVHFEIAVTASGGVPISDLVTPDLIEAQPAERSTVAGPLSDVMLRFGSTVRLIEVVVIAPDQTRYGLVGPQEADTAEEGTVFVLPFADPVSMPGTWLIDYTVHQKDAGGAWFETSAYSSFNIGDAG